MKDKQQVRKFRGVLPGLSMINATNGQHFRDLALDSSLDPRVSSGPLGTSKAQYSVSQPLDENVASFARKFCQQLFTLTFVVLRFVP